MAQGLFNYSQVRRPDGKPFSSGATEVPFNQCKLASFSVDGSTLRASHCRPEQYLGANHFTRRGNLAPGGKRPGLSDYSLRARGLLRNAAPTTGCVLISR